MYLVRKLIMCTNWALFPEPVTLLLTCDCDCGGGYGPYWYASSRGDHNIGSKALRSLTDIIRYDYDHYTLSIIGTRSKGHGEWPSIVVESIWLHRDTGSECRLVYKWVELTSGWSVSGGDLHSDIVRSNEVLDQTHFTSARVLIERVAGSLEAHSGLW